MPRHRFSVEECRLGYARAIESLTARFPDRDAHTLLFAIISRKSNPETRRISRQLTRARRAAAPGSFTAEEWQAVKEKYGSICLCCGEDKPLTVDHVRPLSKGGANDLSNLQPLCRSCNTRKGTRSTDYRPLAAL